MTTIQTIKAASHIFTTSAAANSFNNRLTKPLWLITVTTEAGATEFWLTKPKHAAAMVAEGVATYF